MTSVIIRDHCGARTVNVNDALVITGYGLSMDEAEQARRAAILLNTLARDGVVRFNGFEITFGAAP